MGCRLRIGNSAVSAALKYVQRTTKLVPAPAAFGEWSFPSSLWQCVSQVSRWYVNDIQWHSIASYFYGYWGTISWEWNDLLLIWLKKKNWVTFLIRHFRRILMGLMDFHRHDDFYFIKLKMRVQYGLWMHIWVDLTQFRLMNCLARNCPNFIAVAGIGCHARAS